MLPRRSVVLRYIACILLICGFLLLIWLNATSYFSLTKSLNETAVIQEFLSLKMKHNASFSMENKTIEEVYEYVQHLRNYNPHNFNYLIKPAHICDTKDLFLVTYVHTAPENYKRRTFIRETWGNGKNFPHLNHRVVFLIGKPKSVSIQDMLVLESETYGDIVQEDYVDSYRNLTYKAVHGLKWISNFCSHAKFIMKTDDDIFVNIFNVVSHLQSLLQKENEVRNLLLCLVWSHMKVIRNPKSKWYIPKSEFHADHFSTYCSGSAFMLTTDVVQAMYKASLTTPFFWIDDYYITGILAKHIGVKHRKFNTAYVLGPSTFREKFSDKTQWKNLAFGHVHNINQAAAVWNRIVKERWLKMSSTQDNHTSTYVA